MREKKHFNSVTFITRVCVSLLVGCLFGLLVGCLFGLLVGCLFGLFVCLFLGCVYLVGWFVGLLNVC